MDSGLELIRIYNARKLWPTWSYLCYVEFWNIFGTMIIAIVFIIIVVITTLIIIYWIQFFPYFFRLMAINKTRPTTPGYLLWRAKNWTLNWFISLLVWSVKSTLQCRHLECIPPSSQVVYLEREMLGVSKCGNFSFGLETLIPWTFVWVDGRHEQYLWVAWSL